MFALSLTILEIFAVEIFNALIAIAIALYDLERPLHKPKKNIVWYALHEMFQD